jgi:nitrogen fixation/metabolism regulation signal transduction histidine kinase
MAQSHHPLASHHLPAFITAPGETDVLMVVMSLFLVFVVVMFGVVFLRLHTLPERIAHKSHKIQFEIVAILGLIALFTHMHIFWIAGLLLALIDLPDFGTSLGRIADSTEKIAGTKPREGAAEMQTMDSTKQVNEAVKTRHGGMKEFHRALLPDISPARKRS